MMNTKTQNPIILSVSIFVGMAVIFVVLLLAAGSLENAFAQTILVSLGSAIFGAGLTFFLMRMSVQ
jgi:hypothetical protein